jgi:hypothetical protein
LLRLRIGEDFMFLSARTGNNIMRMYVLSSTNIALGRTYDLSVFHDRLTGLNCSESYLVSLLYRRGGRLIDADQIQPTDTNVVRFVKSDDRGQRRIYVRHTLQSTPLSPLVLQ